MIKRTIIRNGKKYIVNCPTWDQAPWGDTVGIGYEPYILPFVSSQFSNLTTGSGATVKFVAVAGPAGPFDWINYQWQKGGSNLVEGGQITGSITNTLTITNVAAGNNGNYDVIVYNQYGTGSSNTFTLTVI
jgi:hypothetical protein